MLKWDQIDDMTWRYHAESEAQTNEAARQLAGVLSAGDVVGLIGELGAGKTRFVKAIAAALDVPTDEVNSPTFTLIQEYDGRILIRHCDTYRLRNPDEFADLGLDELFASDGLALVEWADRVTEYLPRDRFQVQFTIDSVTARTIEVSATGRRSQKSLRQLNG